MDPYKVLGVTPQTSDDDVKRAYRELARKYHPDNYVNNPLADLAETRMKEINEAYDMIMNERRNPAGGSSGQQQSYGGAYNGQQYGGYQQRTYTGANAALYSQVRQAINQGNLGMAEALLQRAAGRDAEWFYLPARYTTARAGTMRPPARTRRRVRWTRTTRSISTRCRTSICPAATAATGPCRRQACATAVCRRSSATAA